MRKSTLEFGVGLFVLAGLAAVLYLALKLGGSQFFAPNSYQLKAYFSSASGLKQGSRVEIAGVPVGSVSDIVLDPDNFSALATIELPQSIRLDDDTIASIKTSGLIGDRYVSLSPGGSGIQLEPGDIFFDTEPALDIEDLISRFALGNLGSEGSGDE